MQKQNLEINADSPQTNPDLDELNYSPLAESIADGIDLMCPTDGMILAILGGWGYGKSTTINYVLEFLRRKNSNVQPVTFNPWWFSGHEDLVRQLLQEISDGIQPEVKGADDIRNALADLAGAVEWKPKVLGLEIDMKEVFGSRAKALVSTKSVPAIKERIGNLLKEHDIKVLCVVDDVDRLSADEVRDLFRCIKAVGNLSNVVYLLAFDQTIVSEVLDDVYKSRGKDYLDKIIQVSFHLPQPNPEDIANLFSRGLDEILAHLKVSHFDQHRFSMLYHSGIRHLLKSPRDIVRLVNSLRVTLPAVNSEVNHSEFISIEAIRLFLPSLYETIRTNKIEFTDLLSAQSGRNSAESLARFHNNWLAQIPSHQQEWLKAFLAMLFPKLETAWSNIFHSKDSLTGWRRELRVCSPDIFEAYFSFSPPPNTISAKELHQVLSDLDFGRPLDYLRLKVQSHNVQDLDWVWSLFLRLNDHVSEEVKPAAAGALFCFLLDAWRNYKHTNEVRQKHAFIPDNSQILDTLIWKLFERIGIDQRKDICVKTVKVPFAISPMITFLKYLCKQHAKFGGTPEPYPLIAKSDLDEILNLAMEQVKSMIESGEANGAEDLKDALALFSITHEAEMPWFVAKLQETDEGCVALMFVGGGTSYNFSEKGRRVRTTIDLDRVRSLIEPSHLLPFAERIVDSAECSQSMREIASEFISCQQSGKSSSHHYFDDDDD